MCDKYNHKEMWLSIIGCVLFVVAVVVCNRIGCFNMNKPYVELTKGYLVLNGHKDLISAIAFSPDGKLLASGDGNVVYENLPDGKCLPARNHVNIAKVWDSETGRELFSIPGASSVGDLAFSPDGQILAVSYAEKQEIKLWNIVHNRQDYVLPFIGGPLTFSPRGDVLVFGGGAFNEKNDVRFVDVKTHNLLPPSLQYPSLVCSLDYSPDGKLLALGGFGPESYGTIIIFEVPSGRELLRIKSRTRHAKWFPDGMRFVCFGAQDIEIIDWPSGKKRQVIRGASHRVSGVQITPDGKLLIGAGMLGTKDSGAIDIWECDTWKELASIRVQGRGIESLAMSPDGKTIATGDRDGKVQLWKLDDLLKIDR